MADWEKLSETLLTGKEDFYTQLNMGDINDEDYTHTKGACEDF